ncbi:MAG: metallophosphoesterase [Candidatus Marinimicrobia bacterium]|nr:metallophosphoesterase [Candidatus Neomarinimicrobiota bacterium]
MKVRLSISLILALGISLSLSGQIITKGPYLADPKPGSIKIRYETDKQSKGKISYGEDSKLTLSRKAVLLGEASEHFLYEVSLENLDTDSEYTYRVVVGRKKGDLHKFTSPPALEAACDFAISGDSRSKPQIFSKIIDGIAESDPDFIISMGDLVEDGGNYEQWDKFYFGPAKDLISTRPFISTLGDHEGSGDDGRLVEHFLFPELEHEQLWYSFDYGMAHFISLDYRHADSKEMMDWFEADMNTSEGRWNIVFMHRPPYNLGGHRSFWGNPHWPDLFQKHKIDVVFGGHSHIYERFHPVYTKGNEDWAITYITTGGSGASLYESVQHSVIEYGQSVNHYADVHLDGKMLNLRTYEIDGRLMDSLIIGKNPDGSQSADYLNTATLRDEMDIIGLFAGPISSALEYPPLPERPAYKRFTLNSGQLSSPIEFEFLLSDESLENYIMEPFSGVLEPGVDHEVVLKIRRTKGGVKVSPWGDIEPRFRIEAAYQQGSIKGKVLGKYVNMRSWGE